MMDPRIPDYLEYEPEADPPYVPVICLLCNTEQDEADIWFHWVEKHTSAEVPDDIAQ
jgi:hypothetical protein